MDRTLEHYNFTRKRHIEFILGQKKKSMHEKFQESRKKTDQMNETQREADSDKKVAAGFSETLQNNQFIDRVVTFCSQFNNPNQIIGGSIFTDLEQIISNCQSLKEEVRLASLAALAGKEVGRFFCNLTHHLFLEKRPEFVKCFQVLNLFLDARLYQFVFNSAILEFLINGLHTYPDYKVKEFVILKDFRSAAQLDR